MCQYRGNILSWSSWFLSILSSNRISQRLGSSKDVQRFWNEMTKDTANAVVLGSSPGLARGSVLATKLVTLMMGRLGWRNSHWTNGILYAPSLTPRGSSSPYMVSIGVLRWLARSLFPP